MLLRLTSQADQLVDRHCSHALAQRWQTDLVVYETAGHDLPLDDGPWVIDHIARWLASQPSELKPRQDRKPRWLSTVFPTAGARKVLIA